MMIKFAAAALLALTAIPAAAVESLPGGDFEGGLGGFTASGTVSVASGQDYVLGASGSGSPAAQANHFVSFGGGNVGGLDTISQTFTTVLGRTYTVGFDYGAFNATGEQLVFALTGTPGAALSSNGTSNLDALFTHYATTFTGTGQLTTISFSVDALAGDSADIFLDNASVTSAVPDAPTWALLVAGFGLTGLAARRRAAVAA